MNSILHIIYSIGLLLTMTTNLQGQDYNLEPFTIWNSSSEIDNQTIVINEFSRKKIVVKNNPLLYILSEGAEKILRLTKGDTIILITIPLIDNHRPERPIQQITSVRMLLDDSKTGATYIDEFNVGPSTFGKMFFERSRDQVTGIGSYAKHIHVEVLPNASTEIQIDLVGGPYGDMTLIYTVNSPIPKITIHE